MPKTLVLLTITLIMCVLGIGLAFLVGQRTAEERLRSDIERSRAEQRELVAELRRDLTPIAEAATAPAPVVTQAPEDVVAAPQEPQPAPAVSPEDAAPPAPEPVHTEPAPEPVETHMPVEPLASQVETSPQPAAASVVTAPSPPPIAKASFDAVALGTLYTDVAANFGREGLAALTMQDAAGTETKHYFWDWIGSEGQPCRVSMRFVDGRLTDKIYRD